jgi:hypothetical protein
MLGGALDGKVGGGGGGGGADGGEGRGRGDGGKGGSLADMRNLVFMGTLVTAGNGRGIVYATGEATEFGALFRLMKTTEARKTPLQVREGERERESGRKREKGRNRELPTRVNHYAKSRF